MQLKNYGVQVISRPTKKPLSLLTWKLLKWMSGPWPAGEDRSFSFVNYHPNFEADLHLTVAASRLAFQLQSMGWTTTPDKFGRIRLNAAGMLAAAHEPRPDWSPPAPPLLLRRDIDVLETISENATSWMTPAMCGGSCVSHHGLSLTKLTAHGYAICRNINGEPDVTGVAFEGEPSLFRKPRGSRSFKVTPEGQAALAVRGAQRIAA